MIEPKNMGIDELLFHHIVEANEQTPYYRLVGIKTRALAPGSAELVVEIDERHTNPLGRVHGGLIASLADAAMGNAIRSLGVRGVTIDCTISFLSAPPAGALLVGKGRVVKAGRNVIFAEASVYAGEDVVACAQGSFFRTGVAELQKNLSE
ncbi:MAG: PaaI family thioesterase [Syntrophothermus sp.]|uniref:PaaI family thioesterase n=1 Tax=Syntrophothermus sp. TaxID=2736299 RepID=UPI0025808691|nr:PaaI family thioesterase [Syntrophothermus sp.]NSW83882.1 PaaI family thioesterase [Syntrophothermus sp.]